MARGPSKAKAVCTEPTVRVIETFRAVGDYEAGNLKQDAPSCFNGIVRVKRYRITIEEIEEPNEVIKARIQQLCDESKNHHDWCPLQIAAHKYGLELKFK